MSIVLSNFIRSTKNPSLQINGLNFIFTKFNQKNVSTVYNLFNKVKTNQVSYLLQSKQIYFAITMIFVLNKKQNWDQARGCLNLINFCLQHVR